MVRKENRENEMTGKFPRLIHVRFDYPANGDSEMVIAQNGVFDADETERMAIYELKVVGRAVVTRIFEGKRKP